MTDRLAEFQRRFRALKESMDKEIVPLTPEEVGLTALCEELLIHQETVLDVCKAAASDYNEYKAAWQKARDRITELEGYVDHWQRVYVDQKSSSIFSQRRHTEMRQLVHGLRARVNHTHPDPVVEAEFVSLYENIMHESYIRPQLIQLTDDSPMEKRRDFVTVLQKENDRLIEKVEKLESQVMNQEED